MISAVAFCCFGLAGLCGTYRLLSGPHLADRIMALDVVLISLMGGITIDAARRGDSTYLVTLVVLSVVGFTATVAASRFVEDEAEAHDSEAHDSEAHDSEAHDSEAHDPETNTAPRNSAHPNEGGST